MGFEVLILPDGSTIEKTKFEMISEMVKGESVLESRESLPDMLVANAPDPPDWFTPRMPERPKIPKRPSLDNGGELDRLVDLWHMDSVGLSLPEFLNVEKLSDEEHTIVLEYELELESWQDELERWELDRERQRLAQWPWEYARLVMEARR